MVKITDQQKQAIITLTRRANRRIERATPGQQSALLHFSGGAKFSAATKGMSYQEAAKQLKKLEKFLGAETTTRRGWDKVKAEGVRRANQTLKKNYGYDLTDEELSEILEQIDSASSTEYYRAINLVSAKKAEEGGDWEGTADKIAEVIRQKATAQEALEKALKARRK